MSRPAEKKLVPRQKRLIGKIDEIKSYLNGENVCDQDQLRKTNKLQKELEIRINTFQKDREKVETSAVSNSEEEEKYLLEFDELQSIIDTVEDTEIDREYHERNIRQKLEEKKEQEMKEHEERELDIQREMKERTRTKEKKIELQDERE